MRISRPYRRSVGLVMVVVLVRLVFRGGDDLSAAGVDLDVHDLLVLDHFDVEDPLALVALVLGLRGFAADVLLGRRYRLREIDLGAGHGERVVFTVGGMTRAGDEDGERRGRGGDEEFAFHWCSFQLRGYSRASKATGR